MTRPRPPHGARHLAAGAAQRVASLVTLAAAFVDHLVQLGHEGSAVAAGVAPASASVSVNPWGWQR